MNSVARLREQRDLSTGSTFNASVAVGSVGSGDIGEGLHGAVEAWGVLQFGVVAARVLDDVVDGLTGSGGVAMEPVEE